MIGEAKRKLFSGESLGFEEARGLAAALLSGSSCDAEIAGILVALKMKGESVDEICGLALGMMGSSVVITPEAPYLVDTCGTGGDLKGTFNISTAAAFIAAGAGASVAKHGNRGVSSPCGSADVLRELGVEVEANPSRARECIEEVGIGFLFAPTFHPAVKNVMEARRALGVPTVFNILGPLLNPAGARAQVLGVNRAELVPRMGEVMLRLGAERAYVVHGLDGMDEFTLCEETLVCEVRDGTTREYVMCPEELGLTRCGREELEGGDVVTNAAIMLQVLKGKPGARLEVSLANAAFALAASGKAACPAEGVALAREAVRSGRALEKLRHLVELSNLNGVRDVS